MVEMQEELVRLKEESNRRIQNDRNELLSRMELENQLKQQQNRVEIKKK